jgi:hypothetical protein
MDKINLDCNICNRKNCICNDLSDDEFCEMLCNSFKSHIDNGWFVSEEYYKRAASLHINLLLKELFKSGDLYDIEIKRYIRCLETLGY